MPLPHDALVLVADGRKMLFFRNHGDENHLAAVGDEDQRIVGKGHGVFLSFCPNEENAGAS